MELVNFLEQISYALFSLTAFFAVYSLIFSIAGLWTRKSVIVNAQNVQLPFKRMAVLLPAYKEDAVIVDSAKRALMQAYPQQAYEVIVIADSLQPDTLRQLYELPIRVIEVSFDVSTKAKALNAALSQLEGFDVSVILDADNVMSARFLHLVNIAFNEGWRAVQGHRMAKNKNTSVAILDALSEEIQNHILRKGHRSLGLSSALIGSGMAFEFDLFRDLMEHIHTTGGFDKELEMRLLKQRIRINYLEKAICYDEKVQNLAVLERQRSRWIAAQLKYVRPYLKTAFGQLLKGNIDYFDKFIQVITPPRMLLIGAMGFGLVISLLLQSTGLFLLLSGQLLLLAIAYYIATPLELKNQLTWQEFSQLPAVFVRFVRSLRWMTQAGKQFIHTPHNTTGPTPN
ncbi:glycosyltransferase [Spirosoma validum]|uniref:Glycosyltransferase n=1 Tax=Spirosoma validum TaxID=2771355 RepID=A0A927B5V1_9BACT|nr:glycosyltransferase family 2 protein [Spirosoma validum]MBD2756230.1 glycosyltransferase [Spirosoma validum]